MTALGPSCPQPLLLGHQQENYWVQSAVLALQIKGGLQSRTAPYGSNKFPLGEEKKIKKKKKAQAPRQAGVADGRAAGKSRAGGWGMRAEPTGPGSRALRAAGSPATTLACGKIHLCLEEQPGAAHTAGFTALPGAKNVPWLLSHLPGEVPAWCRGSQLGLRAQKRGPGV